MNLNDPAMRRALAAYLDVPYTGDPLVDERLDLIRELVSALEMLEKGRTERAAMQELLLRLDHAIAATEEHVRSMSARLLQLDVRAKDVPARR